MDALDRWRAPGAATVVSAESQRGSHLPVALLATVSADSVLRQMTRPRWLDGTETASLRADVVGVLGTATEEHRPAVEAVLADIDHALAEGTAVALVPPK